MWKVKLDDDVWLAEEGTTTDEKEAWLLPDIISVQEQLKKVRKFNPYKNAMIVFDDNHEKWVKIGEITEKSNR